MILFLVCIILFGPGYCIGIVKKINHQRQRQKDFELLSEVMFNELAVGAPLRSLLCPFRQRLLGLNG